MIFSLTGARRRQNCVAPRRYILALAAALLPWPAWNAGASQSLADLARKEAERRKALQEQGVAGRVVAPDDLQGRTGSGRMTVSDAGTPAPTAQSDTGSPSNRGKPDAYRTRLQSLDRQIREDQEQLQLLEQRMAAERWALPRAGRIVRNRNYGSPYEDLRWKAEQLRARLSRLREERRKVYEEGRKAGFLPGELEGRRITP